MCGVNRAPFLLLCVFLFFLQIRVLNQRSDIRFGCNGGVRIQGWQSFVGELPQRGFRACFHGFGVQRYCL